MKTNPPLSCVRNLLRKRLVFIDEITNSPGVISQVFLNPAGGVLLGFAVQLEGQSRPLLVAINYLLFTENPPVPNQIAALTNAFSVVEEFGEGATTYQDFLGADIVTEEGKPCGQIREVFFEEAGLRTIYEVRAAGWRGLLGQAYFIQGSDGDFYSHRRRRLILSFAATRFKSLVAASKGLPPVVTGLLSGERTSPAELSQKFVTGSKRGHSVFEK